MENHLTEEQRKEAERAFKTGHYKTLSQALVMALYRCVVWRAAKSGRIITIEGMSEYAKKHDQLHPLQDPQFYMVSAEGAIGLSPGLEYLTKWIFIPMEPGEARDAIVAELAAEYKRREEAGLNE